MRPGRDDDGGAATARTSPADLLQGSPGAIRGLHAAGRFVVVGVLAQRLSEPAADCFVRDDEYWATWMLSPAEALDPAGSPTRGIMRGWEV
eukprot:COSAG02_NODE_30625_length_547_cov_25.147321_1_plen_90_part_10